MKGEITYLECHDFAGVLLFAGDDEAEAAGAQELDVLVVMAKVLLHFVFVVAEDEVRHPGDLEPFLEHLAKLQLLLGFANQVHGFLLGVVRPQEYGRIFQLLNDRSMCLVLAGRHHVDGIVQFAASQLIRAPSARRLNKVRLLLFDLLGGVDASDPLSRRSILRVPPVVVRELRLGRVLLAVGSDGILLDRLYAHEVGPIAAKAVRPHVLGNANFLRHFVRVNLLFESFDRFCAAA